MLLTKVLGIQSSPEAMLLYCVCCYLVAFFLSSSPRGVPALGVVQALSTQASSGQPSTTTTPPSRAFLVTGASGYIGKTIVHELLRDEECHNDDITCLVRSSRIGSEQSYWNNVLQQEKRDLSGRVRVLPYDMLDGGRTLQDAIGRAIENQEDSGDELSICVIHVASVFGPTENHKQTALDNVSGTEDLVKTLAAYNNNQNNNNNRSIKEQHQEEDPSSSSSSSCKLVVTSSMAAVRGSGQTPRNGNFYTSQDWNTESKLGANWGSSYQWSKTESERRAWELSRQHQLPMVSLCPSFVFGPPSEKEQSPSSSSFSLSFVGQWVRGESKVQSRLFVDVRDVAAAHVAAAKLPVAVGQRYIVSPEARIPSQEIADWMKEIRQEENKRGETMPGLGEITHDADFDGGAIPIGEKEVDSEQRLREELGITLRPVPDTIKDMARALLRDQSLANV